MLDASAAPNEPPAATAIIAEGAVLRSSFLRLILEPVGIIGAGTIIAIGLSGGGPSLFAWTVSLIFGLYAISCNILLGWAGRMSFGQAACFGAGAYFAALAGKILPSFLIPIGGGLVGILIIVPVGLVAMRSSGLMFAMLTFIWSGIIYQFVFSTEFLGGENGLYGVPPFELFGHTFIDYIPQTIYVATIAALCFAALRWLQATNFGVALQATRDDSIRAALLGIPVQQIYLVTISLSGFVGGVAGALLGQAQSTVDPGLFFWTISGDGIVMALIGGQFVFWGPVLGALILTALRQLIFAGSQQSALLIGLLLLVIVVMAPTGLLGVLDQTLSRVAVYRNLRERLRRIGRRQVEFDVIPRSAAAGRVIPATTEPELAFENIAKAYKGVQALAGVTESVAPGRSTGIIGPNGAGKTTLFSVLSGEIKPNSGRVLLRGRDITRLTASARVRAGISRTFQVARFFNRLPVLDNVLVAAFAKRGGAAAWVQRFGLQPDLVGAAHAALEAVGLAHTTSRIASSLSQAERKRLELAMVLVQSPRVMLLDEPTAGLAKNDAFLVIRLLSELRRSGELTVVISSHDMDVVFGVADRVVLMAQGKVAVSGSPDEVKTSSISRDVYLGSQAARLARVAGSR